MSLQKNLKLEKNEQQTPILEDINNINTNFKSIENSLKKEIYNLKEKIKELEYENEINLLKISEVTKSRNMLLEEELINKRLTEELKAKQEIIEKLQLDMLKEAKDKKEQQRLMENRYNAQLIYYKRLLDTGLAKENAASSFIKLNETQHNYILQLEDKIKEIKNNYEKKIKDMKLDDENRYSKLKKQMMEFLKNSQKNMAKNNEENLELNSKLTILYKNQMLNELENQSHQIEELLKERESQKKEIYMLKQELKVHKKVEQIIEVKNNKYLNLIHKIKKYQQKKEKEKILRKNDFDIELSNSFKIIKNNLDDIPKGKTHQNFFKLKNNITNTEKNKYSHSYQKIQKVNINDSNELLNNIYNNLFKDIIILCNKALGKIIKDKKISIINKSYIFSDDFEFNSLNDKQKIHFLIEIMKKILSFVKIDYENDFELVNIKNNIDLIKIKNNNLLTDRENPKSSNKQKIKYSKIFNIISKNNKDYNSDKRKFRNIETKKIELFNKKIFAKTKKYNNYNGQMISSFRIKSPNPLIRYIHLAKDKIIENKKNNTFYNIKW